MELVSSCEHMTVLKFLHLINLLEANVLLGNARTTDHSSTNDTKRQTDLETLGNDVHYIGVLRWQNLHVFTPKMLFEFK